VQDATKPPRDIWAFAGEDTLRGIFLSSLKMQYDSADEDQKRIVLSAVRYGLAALEHAEVSER
jgi:hypothetical protein